MDATRRTQSAVLLDRSVKVPMLALLLTCGAALGVPASTHAQSAAAGIDPKSPKPPKKPKEPKEPKPSGEEQVPELFRTDAPLALTFTTNIKQLRRDKTENPPWRWAALSYQDSAKGAVQIPLRVHTRGFWRLKSCTFPPVRMNFSDKETKHTLFHDLEKPKLVNYCRDTDSYEQYILQELQLYRVYQQLTPVSHRVRLAKLAYVDSANGKREAERYAIIVEDPERLARRHSAQVIKLKGAGADDLDHPQLALAYLFQYFIGNLDFSFSGLHNTELIGTSDGRILPVAYDFDFAGAVNASYATPPPDYQMRSVRIRRFLGSCAVAAEYPAALARFLEKKEAIYGLYRDEIGKRMDPGVVRETLAYFDDFYDAVRTPEAARRNVFDSCVKPH
ncbi:MAG: hypothetical protein JWL95_1286 [Gemmatimonadetes bacterium]|nr:hypothetical protein [Gemmatimonadota bacterium]